MVVRSRGLEPPRVAPLAPQASASTNSATTAEGMNASRRPRVEGARCNKSTLGEQGPRPSGPVGGARPNIDPYLPATGQFLRPRNLASRPAAARRTTLSGYPRGALRARRDGSTSSGYKHVVVSTRDD